jgi:hypothetical protein
LFKRLCQLDDGFEGRRLGLILGGSDESVDNAPMNIESDATRPCMANVLQKRPASGIVQRTVDRSTTGCATAQTAKML